MKNETNKKIFKKGSKTYYNSSLFFPKKNKEEVETLYAYVRKMDDFVDEKPKQKEQFLDWKKQTKQAFNGKKVNEKIIKDVVKLAQEKGMHQDWFYSFIESMENDLNDKICKNFDDTLKYMYGSAEVIGLMMNRILNIPKKADNYAQLLGRAMQYINFIRDIDEDIKLQRTYLPFYETKWKTTKKPKTKEEKIEFKEFVRKNIKKYYEWDDQARTGFKYIPYRFRVPIKTAADMYRWTAKEIEKDPMIVFDKKVKPKKSKIFGYGIWTMVREIWN